MISKVFKYYEFLFEGNTPEDFIKNCLMKIKDRLDPIFGNTEENSKVKKMKDFENVELKSSDPSMYSPEEKSLKFKFTDEDQILYQFNIRIKIEDAISKDIEKDFMPQDIKKAHITLDKYGDKDGTFTIISQIMDRTVDPATIDGDFLLNLKIELDSGKEPEQTEEFEIQTGEEGELPKEESETPAQGQAAPQKAPQTQAQTPQ
jgi:hypothetical protein